MLSPEAANRELFNMWMSGSTQSPIAAETLRVMKESVVGESHLDISRIGGYITRWYIPEEEIEYRMTNRAHVLAMDTSEAGGRDDISLVVTDVKTLEVVACGTYNETNLLTMAEWVFTWFEKYPKLVGIIERRSTGQFLMDVLCRHMLAAGMDPFKRLFNMVVHDKDQNPSRYEEIKVNKYMNEAFVNRYKTSFGYATSGSGATSRSELYSTTLQLSAKNAASKIRDKGIVDQIAGLIIKNGRIDHQDGQHDDLVVGWLLSIWFLTKGKNLSYYGIDPGEVMSNVVVAKPMSPQEREELEEQNKLRIEMKAIGDLMKDESDPNVQDSYERRLRFLNTRLTIKEGEHLSIDALITDLKNNRKMNMNKNPYANSDPYGTSESIYRLMSNNTDYGGIILSY